MMVALRRMPYARVVSQGAERCKSTERGIRRKAGRSANGARIQR